MVSVQECLQVPLDKWTTREQLCLLSAVISSGDQNWMVVSRDLKVLCGSNRPADWFSQKSCVAQYEELVRNAENLRKAVKLKVEATFDDPLGNCGKSPTDLLLKQLTEARIKELKAEIQKDQEEYAKLYVELNSVKNGHLTDEQVAEMWKELQKEQELQRIEEMKMENLLREREQRNQDMQRNWRTGSGIDQTNYSSQVQDDKNRSSHQDITGANNKLVSNGSKQQPPQSTSPLLSSLLKSPTPSSSSPTLGSAAHVTAPTITSLLTGGVINPNRPVITLKNTIPPSEASQLLMRPISGPPSESMSVAGNISQNSLSPSQSAPTLSMLLEKNKPLNAAKHTTTTFSSEVTSSNTTSVSDSNNEEVPMDIEEDVATTIASTADLMEGSDGDANEEQQLLEVFKNIGNIDDLEDIDVAAVIDEEVDFLKSVGEEPAEVAGNEKIDINHCAKAGKNKVPNKLEEESDLKPGEPNIAKVDGTDNIVNKQNRKEIESKIENSSSDDSNDDIPLSTLGGSNLTGYKDITNKNEGKLNSTFIKEQINENRVDDGGDEDDIQENCNTPPPNNNDKDGDNEEIEAYKNIREHKLKSILSKKSPNISLSDIIIIPTDDESSGDSKWKLKKTCANETQEQETEGHLEGEISSQTSTEARKIKEDIHQSPVVDSLDKSIAVVKESKKFETEDFTSTSDACSDISIINTGNKKVNYMTEKPSASLKKAYQDLNLEHKLDYEINFNETLAKTPVISKLERDRSESPVTANDEDTTASELSMTQRPRRRKSYTPLIDSIPNSPASSDRDDRDAKTSKKALMNIYNSVINCKHALAFQRAQSEQSTKLYEICNRNINFQIIKKNIEIGTIRNIQELQRDIFLLCQNGIMAFESNSANYKTVRDFQKDFINIKEFLTNSGSGNTIKIEKDVKDTKTSTLPNTSSTHSSGVKVRGSSRKSQRITSS